MKISVCFLAFALFLMVDADEAVTRTASPPKPEGPVPRSKLPIPGSGKCGMDNADSGRIIGGEATQIDEFPWLVLLEYKYKGNQPLREFRCGGSLITEKHVLTAAHCVKNAEINRDFDLTSVRLGEWNMDTEPDCVKSRCAPPHIVVPVKKITPYPSYEPETQHHDIALIELAEPVTFTAFVHPICLPTTPEMRRDTVVQGKKFVVAGWGLTELDEVSQIKLKTEVEGVTNEQCDRLYSGLVGPVTDQQLCAGGGRKRSASDLVKDSCHGDSGGPLMATTSNSPVFTYLAGVISYGNNPCGTERWPSVYTRVASYIDWIEARL